MTTFLFWLIAALLIGIALLVVVVPLLRGYHQTTTSQRALNIAIHRDQLAELDADLRTRNLNPEQYAQAQDELKRRLLDDVPQRNEPSTPPPRFGDRRLAAVLALTIPLTSILLYAALGNQQGLSPQTAAQKSEQPHTPEQVLQMVERLAARLEQSPQDAQGWALLGRAYYSLRRYGDARLAFAKAASLAPNDAQTLVDYADALAIDNGQGLVGKPLELIGQALKLEPDNPKALTLAGSAAFDKQNYAAAAAYWDKLLPLLPPESEFSRDIAAGIARARQLGAQNNKKKAAPDQDKREPLLAAQGDAGKQSANDPPKTGAPPAQAGVSGTVKLSVELARTAKPNDTVFIFARAKNQKAPLAVIRKQVRDLPTSFFLTDASALIPELKISNHKQVIIGARVSKTGSAIARKDDYEGFSQPVKVGSRDVAVTIDKIVR